ncbi:hypothetical protein [Streptomyces sp. SM13]|uniref:hypothetical protein n=1 Tax=Streptomyces sp. SM13 TaxID=1983803 RepID=UPI0011B0424E|nr:hypothetical protein [Streptomyces sp. SM13]
MRPSFCWMMCGRLSTCRLLWDLGQADFDALAGAKAGTVSRLLSRIYRVSWRRIGSGCECSGTERSFRLPSSRLVMSFENDGTVRALNAPA